MANSRIAFIPASMDFDGGEIFGEGSTGSVTKCKVHTSISAQLPTSSITSFGFHKKIGKKVGIWRKKEHTRDTRILLGLGQSRRQVLMFHAKPPRSCPPGIYAPLFRPRMAPEQVLAKEWQPTDQPSREVVDKHTLLHVDG